MLFPEYISEISSFLLFSLLISYFKFFSLAWAIFLNVTLRIFYYFYIFRSGKREGEKYQCVVASHVPPPGDLAYNPGMCPSLGIELDTLLVTDWHLIHWATPARALVWTILILLRTPLVWSIWWLENTVLGASHMSYVVFTSNLL